MKKSGHCPKCESTRVGHLDAVPDEADDYGIVASTIGQVVKQRGRLIKVFSEERQGELEAYVCTDCGYYETYVKSPESVPFSEIRGFRYVNR